MVKLRRFEFEELPRAVATALAPRVERLGYLGEFFKCAAHQPEALEAFIGFTEAGKKGLANNLVEVIALTCAGWMGNAYERNQHERLCRTLGFTPEWVETVNRLDPARSGALTEEERLVQAAVLGILDSKGKAGPEWIDRVVTRFGDAAAIALLMVVGRYVTHGLIVNSLDLSPPVPSIFEADAK